MTLCPQRVPAQIRFDVTPPIHTHLHPPLTHFQTCTGLKAVRVKVLFPNHSLVASVESHTRHSKETDPRGDAEDGQHLPLVGVAALCGGEKTVQGS